MADFPRLWMMLGFLLPRTVRKEVWGACRGGTERGLSESSASSPKSMGMSLAHLLLHGPHRDSRHALPRAWIGDRGLSFLKKIGLAILGGAVHSKFCVVCSSDSAARMELSRWHRKTINPKRIRHSPCNSYLRR